MTDEDKPLDPRTEEWLRRETVALDAFDRSFQRCKDRVADAIRRGSNTEMADALTVLSVVATRAAMIAGLSRELFTRAACAYASRGGHASAVSCVTASEAICAVFGDPNRTPEGGIELRRSQPPKAGGT